MQIKEVSLSRFTVADPRFEPQWSGSQVCNHCVILPVMQRKVFLFQEGRREIGLGGLVLKCGPLD